MQAGPPRRRGARASALDNKQREFTVSSFGPVAKGGPDESGVPGYVGGPVATAGRLCVTPGVRPDGYAGGPAAVAGRSCVTLGLHSSE